MQGLRDQMEADLKIAGYSKGTQKTYLYHAQSFANHFQRSPKDMGADEIRQYMLHLIEEHQCARSTLRGVRAALCFLYKATLNRESSPFLVEILHDLTSLTLRPHPLPRRS